MLSSTLFSWLNRWFPLLLLIGIAINVSGIGITILEPDGALYAGIAKTMLLKNDWVNLYAHGRDWLDKPHFPFWVTALSFKLFGIITVAYKLPALLFWALGAVYTYRFGKLFYNKSTAQLAVLIYLTAQHLVISNNDVRAEPYLTGLLIASMYHLYRSANQTISVHLLIGCLLAAAAVMTKGIFILVPIVAGLGIHWLIKKDWRALLHVRWLLAALLIGLFITPELWCLYQQFDRHPEKVVFGRTNVSGLQFFFWDSQFGRFMNTGPIKGKGDPFFFVHTLLWAFLPWSLLLYAAFFQQIKALLARIPLPEYCSIGASVITLLLFSFSRFQLPHYSNILFPFFALITAHFLVSLKTVKSINNVSGVQHVLLLLLVLASIGLVILFRPQFMGWAIAGITIITAAGIYLFRRPSIGTLVGRSVLASLLINGFMNLFFYPQLLQYQAGTVAARWLNRQTVTEPVGMYDPYSYSFDFYNQRAVHYWTLDSIVAATKQQPVVVYMQASKLDSLASQSLEAKILASFLYFPITKLNLKFVNAQTRSRVVKEMWLVRVQAKK